MENVSERVWLVVDRYRQSGELQKRVEINDEQEYGTSGALSEKMRHHYEIGEIGKGVQIDSGAGSPLEDEAQSVEEEVSVQL